MRIAAATLEHTPGIAGKFPVRSAHPDKEEDAMGHSKNRSVTEGPKPGKMHQSQESPSGGREFGQVIEPMQAQMASENEGLAESPKSAPAKKEGTRNKHKAA
jgi:hypothetical protein